MKQQAYDPATRSFKDAPNKINTLLERPDCQEREFGPDGLPIRDVDYDHDHGQGIPHEHDWTRDLNGKPVREQVGQCSLKNRLSQN
jgi:hypothetical protein